MTKLYIIFFSLLFSKNNNIKNNIKSNSNSYKINNLLSIRQKIYTQFKKKDNRLYNIGKSMHCQKKLLHIYK